jgi:hypothetical protein
LYILHRRCSLIFVLKILNNDSKPPSNRFNYVLSMNMHHIDVYPERYLPNLKKKTMALLALQRRIILHRFYSITFNNSYCKLRQSVVEYLLLQLQCPGWARLNNEAIDKIPLLWRLHHPRCGWEVRLF